MLVSSHLVACENVDDAGQVLTGLTAGAGAGSMLADWPDGTLAEYTLVPAETVRVLVTLRQFLREGTPWRSVCARADRVSGSTLRRRLSR